MIQCQLKLRPTKRQEATLEQWLFHLASVWNFAVRKIELNARDRIYFSKRDFQNLLANHSEKLGIPSHTLQGTLLTAYLAWQRCFKGISGRPRLKGQRNRLNSIPFPDPIKQPQTTKIRMPGLGLMCFHRQQIPSGKIKGAQVVKRASGWYVCLFIDTQREQIYPRGLGLVGIDPGFKTLLTLSNGEKINHPKEFRDSKKRLAQIQRGSNSRLLARFQERIKNRRRNRNHKLSYQLVATNQLIAFSLDNQRGMCKRFGKSVGDSAHRQLRQMLSYKSKCRTDGLGVYVEVDSRNSTKTCSACGALSGPAGLVGLKVRRWTCVACGAEHDRDINAAVNTLIAGAGLAHEMSVKAA